MPVIHTYTSTAVSREQRESLKATFGQAIEAVPGKSEQWLMLSLEDKCRLYFKGDNSKPIAYVEVKVFGKIDYSQSNKLTAKICEILDNVLGIDASNVYIKYEEVDMWGWNGSNF